LNMIIPDILAPRARSETKAVTCCWSSQSQRSRIAQGEGHHAVWTVTGDYLTALGRWRCWWAGSWRGAGLVVIGERSGHGKLEPSLPFIDKDLIGQQTPVGPMPTTLRPIPSDVEGMFQNGWFQQQAGQLDAAQAAYSDRRRSVQCQHG
jgi:hypothetical protein